MTGPRTKLEAPSPPDRVTDERTYAFKLGHPTAGWWPVMSRFTHESAWEIVAHVFGERRAEIVRDALSEELNVRV